MSAFVGLSHVGHVVDPIAPLAVPVLSGLPVVGRLLFAHSPFVYLSLVLFVLVQWFLFGTRAGLVLRAIGESPQSAHAIGHKVIAVRYAAVAFGGACAGLSGAYMALAYAPMWTEGMTAGRGWIALALVVFANWKPWRVLAGAYLFGAVTLVQFQAQAMGVAVPVAISGDAALCGDDRRARADLARRDGDPFECAGVAGPAVPRRYLKRERARSIE